ncbi:hypothetical protein DFH07DRAFT_784856 [Mycena maculata]|uniref:Uncharacterized protein n=1 Tax=Mycena maculata TaxID=230809 RepID=A0AAD7MJ44_9AGAR|nr:hypothetical protein DFH07DRAFT_784856 [Mycena maculata]
MDVPGNWTPKRKVHGDASENLLVDDRGGMADSRRLSLPRMVVTKPWQEAPREPGKFIPLPVSEADGNELTAAEIVSHEFSATPLILISAVIDKLVILRNAPAPPAQNHYGKLGKTAKAAAQQPTKSVVIPVPINATIPPILVTPVLAPVQTVTTTSEETVSSPTEDAAAMLGTVNINGEDKCSEDTPDITDGYTTAEPTIAASIGEYKSS